MYETDTFEFTFSSGNKIARIEIGQDKELFLSDVLEAVQNILTVGGYTYIDEVRAVNYGERYNKIYSSNSEDSDWNEEIEVPPPEEDIILEKNKANNTLGTLESKEENIYREFSDFFIKPYV